MAETEERSEGLTLQKIVAEKPEAFLKEPPGGSSWRMSGHLGASGEHLKIIEKPLWKIGFWQHEAQMMLQRWDQQVNSCSYKIVKQPFKKHGFGNMSPL